MSIVGATPRARQNVNRNLADASLPRDHSRHISSESGSSVCRSRPPKDKEVATAERAPKRQKNPVESCFKGIPISDASEVDRTAMWTPREEHFLQYLDSPCPTLADPAQHRS